MTSFEEYSWAAAVKAVGDRVALRSIQPTELVRQKETGGKFW